MCFNYESHRLTLRKVKCVYEYTHIVMFQKTNLGSQTNRATINFTPKVLN